MLVCFFNTVGSSGIEAAAATQVRHAASVVANLNYRKFYYLQDITVRDLFDIFRHR
jgi:hypothetical protein